MPAARIFAAITTTKFWHSGKSMRKPYEVKPHLQSVESCQTFQCNPFNDVKKPNKFCNLQHSDCKLQKWCSCNGNGSRIPMISQWPAPQGLGDMGFSISTAVCFNVCWMRGWIWIEISVGTKSLGMRALILALKGSAQVSLSFLLTQKKLRHAVYQVIFKLGVWKKGTSRIQPSSSSAFCLRNLSLGKFLLPK